MQLDFRKARDAEIAADDERDMDDAMSDPPSDEAPVTAPVEAVPGDEVLCCPKCQHEFPAIEGVYEEDAPAPDAPVVEPVTDDLGADDFDGFTMGGR